jgi:surface protein
MFSGCNSLESIDLTKFNSSLTTNMSSMFQGCNSLKLVDLSNFITSSVTSMNNMFSECNSLEYVDLLSFDTSSVKDMSSMFLNCSNLQYLDLSYFDTSNVTHLTSIFSGCISLKVLDISSFDMKNVQDYKDMFKSVNLRYLNLYQAKNFIVDEQINSIDNLLVCQNEKIIKNEKIIRKCCYFDILTDGCISSNYILINYGKDTTYENGFGLEESKINIVNKFKMVSYMSFKYGSIWLIRVSSFESKTCCAPSTVSPYIDKG